MGDFRGALVDIAGLEDTILVFDIRLLYQLSSFRQALCLIFFVRPGVPAVMIGERGRVRPNSAREKRLATVLGTINFLFPGKS